MVTGLRKNPVVIAALLCATVLYASLAAGKPLQFRAQSFSCLLPLSEIRALEGSISSNPVKTESGVYRVRFSPHIAFSKDGCSSTASGSLVVFIPAALLEALYPGKSYTLSQGSASAAGGAVSAGNALSAGGAVPAALVESGARLRLTGRAAGAGAGTGAGGAGRTGGAGAVFFAERIEQCIWQKTPGGTVAHLRALSRLHFKRLMFSWNEAGGFVLALLSGSREYLDGVLAAAFAAAGLSHILALSGMHLTLFAGFSRLLSRRLFSRRIAAVVQLCAVCAFIWFAGLSPSLFRAWLCLLIFELFALLKLRRPPLLTVLSAAFLVHVVVFPAHCYELSFTLSYSALAGIALFSALYRALFSRLRVPLAASFSDAAGAQTATLPLSVAVFSRVAPFGIVACVAVSPLVGFFLYAALAGVIISLLFPFLTSPVRAIITAIYALLKQCVLFFAHLPSVTFC